MDAIFSYSVAVLPALALGLAAVLAAYLLLKRDSRSRRIIAALALSALTFMATWLCLGGGVFISLQDSRPQPFLKPSAADITGIWRMPQTLVDYLQAKGISSSSNSLILNEDGTFQMTAIPNLWGPWDPSRPPISGAGSWAIARLPYGFGQWALSLAFHAIDPATDNDHAELFIEGTKPPYRLYIPKGELGDALVLERE